MTLITCYKCGKRVPRARQAKYCAECAAEVNREDTLRRYYANREERLAVQKRYHATHREQARERYHARKKKKAPKG